MTISVCIPTYDAKVPMHLAAALAMESAIAAALGIMHNIRFLASCTNLAFGRNGLVKDFLDSKDDRLVFVDADVTFEPGSLIRIAKYPVDFVGGAYPKKEAKEVYPVNFLPPNEEKFNVPLRLLEVAMVPTGFLSLSRQAFEKFAAYYPGREYMIGGRRVYCYFQIPYLKKNPEADLGSLYTEDVYFCNEWRAAGGTIYLDPDIELIHWAFNTPYRGHIGNWLRKRAQDAARKQQELEKGVSV